MRRIDVIALGIGVALLVIGPLALTLARADSYKSTAVVSLNPDNPSARYLHDPRGLLGDPVKLRDLQHNVAKDVGWLTSSRELPDRVHVASRGGGEFAVVAEGPGGQEAQQLADAAAHRLRDAAETAGVFVQSAQAKNLPPGPRRDAVRAALRTHADLYGQPGPATLPKERIGDRLLGALPGKRRFRPDPIWVTVAGIALAMALVLWARALAPVRSRRSGSATG